MIQVVANSVLVSKYSCYASFQTNAEAWVASEELKGVGKSICGRGWECWRVALLQLLSHLPSLTDDNTAFLLASGGRTRVNLLLQSVFGPLCTNFYIVSFKKPQIFGVLGLHLVMLFFLAKMFYYIKYLKKSCVNIADSIEHLSCTFYSCESYFICVWSKARNGLKLLKGKLIVKLKWEERVFAPGFHLRSTSRFDSRLEDSWAVKINMT